MNRTATALSCVMVAAACLTGNPAAATDNVPNLAGYRTVGRLGFFASPKRVQWIVPVAFNTALECAGSESAARRTCYLRVYNVFNDAEVAALQALNGDGHVTATLSNLNSNIVTSIDETQPGLPNDFTSPMQLRTLAVGNNKVPYFSVAARVTAARAAELTRQFSAGEGIGAFVVRLSLVGEMTDGYLAILVSQKLATAITTAPATLTASECRKLLRSAIDGTDIQYSSDWNRADTLAIALELAKRVLFKPTDGQRRLTPALDALPPVGAPLVLSDESAPITGTCVARILFKAGAAQTLECTSSD